MSDTCFVTGGTGFLGRFVIKELLERDATIYALVRPQSVDRLRKITQDLGADETRVIPVPGDVSRDGLTVEPFDEAFDHLFHLAAIYDMDADAEAIASANIDGTKRVLAWASGRGAPTFHMVSSVAAAGDHIGTFAEEDPRHGQSFPHAYHRSKFESEVLVRDNGEFPFKIYRPGAVVGTTDTGETDKLDGVYALFPLAAALSSLPSRAVIPVPRFGRLPTVPVDRTAQAIAEIGLRAGIEFGDTFGLYSDEDERVHDVLAALSEHAGGPRISAVLPEITGSVGFWAANVAGRLPIVGDARNKLLNAIGVPAGLVDAAPFRCAFETKRTHAALAGSGIVIPPIREYLPALWEGWKKVRREQAA